MTQSDATTGPPTLLIVDDDADIRATLSEYLQAQDYRICEAENASAARSAIKTQPVDLAILDLRMPGEDGLSLCRHLRETTDLPIIMLTGADDPTDRVVGLEIGADDYIAKPFELREVLARIRALLRREDRAKNKLQPASGDLSADDMERIRSFLAGGAQHDANRVVLTVLFTDIVDSTRLAAAYGDRKWTGLLDEHNDLVRRAIAENGGLEIKTLGDGFMAVFDTPGRALRCADAARESVAALDLTIRAGVHTGECELKGDDIAGVAVHLAARVIGHAGPGETAVSNTVKELMTGASARFEDRGVHELKGIPGAWRIFVHAGSDET